MLCSRPLVACAAKGARDGEGCVWSFARGLAVKSEMHQGGLSLCVSLCAAVGKNNIKEGGPHGSRAPSGRLRRQL